MSTYDHYVSTVERGTWDVPATGAARFNWEYDNGRARLLDLYQRGKDKQWDATKRIDWGIPVDPTNVMEQTEELSPIYGSRQWEKLNQAERDELGLHLSSWLFSQFLHGEQGRPDRRGQDRRVGARHGLQVLRRYPGDGRGQARRAVPAVHQGQDRHLLPDQR
jgi:hypothetical protein